MRGTAIRIQLTPDRLERLDIMAGMLGLSRAGLVKVILDDKWIGLQKHGMIAAFKKIKETTDEA